MRLLFLWSKDSLVASHNNLQTESAGRTQRFLVVFRLPLLELHRLNLFLFGRFLDNLTAYLG